MNRRHQVEYAWRPTPEQWNEIRVAARTLGRAGLVAELVADENAVTLFAARRVKPGKKADE